MLAGGQPPCITALRAMVDVKFYSCSDLGDDSLDDQPPSLSSASHSEDDDSEDPKNPSDKMKKKKRKSWRHQRHRSEESPPQRLW